MQCNNVDGSRVSLIEHRERMRHSLNIHRTKLLSCAAAIAAAQAQLASLWTQIVISEKSVCYNAPATWTNTPRAI